MRNGLGVENVSAVTSEESFIRTVVKSVGLRLWPKANDQRLSSVQQSAGNRRVAVDAAVTQERPIPADVLEFPEVDLADQDLFPVMRGFGDHGAKRITQERSAPEFESLAGSRLSPNIAGFVADAVDYSDIHSVGNRVCTLNRSPRIMLRLAELGFLGRMPTDGRGIEQHACPLQSGEPSAFRIPLVPAHQGPDFADVGIVRAEAEVARREIELLVIQRI